MNGGGGNPLTVFERTLRALVREELLRLSEDAASPAAAATAGLALMTPPDGMGAYVLYDQDKAVSTLLDMSGETSRELAKALTAAGAVVGMLYVDKTAQCWEARTVMSVAAQRGYGPLLYDVAMADGPLAPMRDSVSLSAERVWRHYYERRPDVVHEPLRQCRKHVSVRPWLNFKYTLTGSPPVGPLRARHEGTVEELSYDFSRADVEAALRGAADKYFDSRYTEA